MPSSFESAASSQGSAAAERKSTSSVRTGSARSSRPSWVVSPRRNAPRGETVVRKAVRGKLVSAPLTPFSEPNEKVPTSYLAGAYVVQDVVEAGGIEPPYQSFAKTQLWKDL